MAKSPAVKETFYYDVPPARVFAALTEPKGLCRWLLEDAEFELRKDAPFRFRWIGGYSMKGEVRKFRKGRTVELAWNDRPPKGKTMRTVARFELKAQGPGTLLALRHTGFKAGRRWLLLRSSVQAGWAYYLTNLRSVLEHGVDLRSELDSVV
jgi:uncharacterized protein YndB with AHSA1/START domain